MITLKNGVVIKYNQDFDFFFQDLIEAIIRESKKVSEKNYEENKIDKSLNDLYLRELMDNCIFVTHQLFEISKDNEEFSKFVVTGFLFNSIVLSLPKLEKEIISDNDNKEIIH